MYNNKQKKYSKLTVIIPTSRAPCVIIKWILEPNNVKNIEELLSYTYNEKIEKYNNCKIK